jgi:CDP-diacylglycerol---serine O-phosphatidyltransferase
MTMRHQLPRPNMRRAIVLLPNGFTLANLFFGVFAIVSAFRKDFFWAGWCVVLGGLMDALDGRIARITRTTSRFGIELDSLVDAVSFGVAPAFIMYVAVLNQDGWAWLFCFIYIACVVMRLARFNSEQGGRAKTHFHGLPSPVAGMALATYYWFSQTTLYTGTIVESWPWHTVLPGLMLVLSFLMISHVLYPAPPKLSLRSIRGALTSAFLLGVFVLVMSHPKQYAFPAMMGYVAFGLGKTLFLGLIDRIPARDPLNDTEDEGDDDDDALRPASIAERPGGKAARRRFRRVREAMNPFSHPPEDAE